MLDVLADCKKCFRKRCDAVMQDRHSKSNLVQCNDCCQWDLNSKSLLAKKVVVPEKYPTECAPDSPEVPVAREMGALYGLTSAVLIVSHNVTAVYGIKD